MKPAAFHYHAPATLDEALALLARHGNDAKVLAGGQSLVPMMNMRIARPEHVIDINRLDELAFIREANGAIEIGALTRHLAIERSALLRERLPLLPVAAQTIAHYAIRTQGTLGGSLAHADPAAQWPLLAVALGAKIIARGPNTERALDAGSFFVSTMTTALEPSELVVASRWPLLPARTGWGFELFARRRGDFALCAVCATVSLKQSRVDNLRVVVGGVTPTPADLSGAMADLGGTAADAALAQQAGQIASAKLKPSDDPKAAAWYRTELMQALVERAVQQAMQRAGK